MRIRCSLLVLMLLLAAVLHLITPSSVALAQSCSPPYYVEQGFPTAGSEETRWRVCWQPHVKHGLVITSAHFRTSPDSPWIRLFWDARVSEIFLPYHGNEVRLYEMSRFKGIPLTTNDCPASQGGTLLGISFPEGPQVCKQVRDRGIAWKNDQKVRRGEELALWGAVDADNYNYIIEWTFRDDGVVSSRVGATAYNYLNWPLVRHTHNVVWRLDIDLDGAAGDSVHLGIHTETGLKAKDTHQTITHERGLEWNPLAFHTLDIRDATLKNGRGHPTSYHLVPLRSGTSRHQERFTRKDFWVTRSNPLEMWAKDLPKYVDPPQSVVKSDIVVWYIGSIHHVVRDEDGGFVDEEGRFVKDGGSWKGVTHVVWTGFMLEPHNIFNKTPLYP